MIKHRLHFFILILCLQVGATFSQETQNPYLAKLHHWENVLKKFVDAQGRVNFEALQKKPDDLSAFVSAIKQVSPMQNPELFSTSEAVIAYHINAYNALAMQGVLDRDIPNGFTNFFKRASFFKLRGVVIGGEKTNLYDYENRVIRPLDEPRSHFALNCMVKDCPRLPQVPFVAEKLDEQLEAATLEFINTPKHLELDEENKTVYVSSIFKFYTKDFVASGKRQDLLTYINTYRNPAIPDDYKVEYMDYDWRINKQ